MQPSWHAAFVCLLFAACSINGSDHPQACEHHRECAADAYCVEGFCIAQDAPAQCAQIEACYDGPEATRDVGACKAGQRLCVEGAYSDCLGQVLPADETCNGADDDCDSIIDEGAGVAACDTQLNGACRSGRLECRAGVEHCAPSHESQAETCNAIDDDCDGPVDEMQATLCYPQAEGCALDDQGTWQCQGRCATGFVACEASGSSCDGATTPIDEACTQDGAIAQDENCDGVIDEACNCEDGATRPCFAGPLGSDQGRCAFGEQRCTGNTWGACEGQTLPRAETCDNPNEDDDCNGIEDDVPGRGLPCIALAEMGECRYGSLECMGDTEPECVGSEPKREECDELDQDCDGDPTNGFDLSSDARCGACDTRCSASQDCCGGSCAAVADFEDDFDNCGGCGNTCGEGQYCCQGDCLSVATRDMMACDCSNDCGDRACCGKDCRDLDTDKDHCGACGLKCGPGKTCEDGVCK